MSAATDIVTVWYVYSYRHGTSGHTMDGDRVDRVLEVRRRRGDDGAHVRSARVDRRRAENLINVSTALPRGLR